MDYKRIQIPRVKNFWRKFWAYAGPGYLVSVGYIDPGNWATDIAGGAQFGYALLAVILISNLMAILLQSLCVRLAVATNQDLAQACRAYFPAKLNYFLWFICELAIIACDLAELLGSAIALYLLFKIPLLIGVIITSVDVVFLLMLQNKSFRHLEVLITLLISLVAICFFAEIYFSKPDLTQVLQGYIPTLEIVQNPEMLYLAIGILGATVMPHNLYLHSSIVQTRAWKDPQEALKFATLDSSLALSFALFVNSAILIVSAATFHFSGYQQVSEIQEAYRLLSPLLGISLASLFFGLALLAAGQSSTITATLAGQIVMEGFLQLKIAPWLRRLITRLLALIPAVFVIICFGEQSTGKLLIFSQVVLSLQLPFAVIPLVMFTSNPHIMGKLRNPFWLKSLAWIVTLIIVILNFWLLWQIFAPYFL